MSLDLSDEESAALLAELDRIIRDDRYPLSRRIRTLKAIVAKIRPEPIRAPIATPEVLCATACDSPTYTSLGVLAGASRSRVHR
jgi:hypothetical protein